VQSAVVEQLFFDNQWIHGKSRKCRNQTAKTEKVRF